MSLLLIFSIVFFPILFSYLLFLFDKKIGIGKPDFSTFVFIWFLFIMMLNWAFMLFFNFCLEETEISRSVVRQIEGPQYVLIDNIKVFSPQTYNLVLINDNNRWEFIENFEIVESYTTLFKEEEVITRNRLIPELEWLNSGPKIWNIVFSNNSPRTEVTLYIQK